MEEEARGAGHDRPVPAVEVAPASLMSTFVTSVAGVATFSLLAIRHQTVAPNWVTGIAMGASGLAGGYIGARIQHRLPESLIRRVLAASSWSSGRSSWWTD